MNLWKTLFALIFHISCVDMLIFVHLLGCIYLMLLCRGHFSEHTFLVGSISNTTQRGENKSTCISHFFVHLTTYLRELIEK
jgi:hypothetical protein